MKAHRLHALLACFIAFAIPQTGVPNADAQDGGSTDESAVHAGVRAAIDHYFKGHATGDPSHMRKAFLPTAHIEGIREGKFTSWTLEEYCARFTGKPERDETNRVRKIDSIDVSGNSAMAKATLDHGATVFTDYFVLLKVDAEWRIANKVYYANKKASGGLAR